MSYLNYIYFSSPSPLSGVSPGNGAGDPSGVDGPRGHLPPHLLLTAARWKRAGQLCGAEVHRRAAGGLAAQSGGRSESDASQQFLVVLRLQREMKN